MLESEESELPAEAIAQAHKPLANANFTLPPAPAKPLEIGDLLPPADDLNLSSDPVMGDVVPGTDGPTGEELAQSWDETPKKSHGGKIAGILLAALLISFGALGYIYHEQVLDEWSSLQTYLAGPSKAPPVPAAPAAPHTPPASTVGMSSSNTPTPLKPADAVSTEQGEAVVNPAKPGDAAKPAEPPPAVTPPKAVEPPKPSKPSKPAEPAKPAEPVKPAEPAKPADPPKPVEQPKPAKPAEPAKPASASIQADDTAWVAQLKDDVWVMQHGAFDSLSEARSFQASSLGYRAGQVFYTQRKGSKPYYILITGPYADKGQAEALMRQNPPLAKAWLRSAKSLKIQFQD